MSDSILTSTKKLLGLDETYTAFDLDVMMHVNSALSTLTQVGIGPSNGFMIQDADATWETFMGPSPKLNLVQSYVYFHVRLAFDPPATSFGIGAMEKQKDELLWRLNVDRETTAWVDPDPVPFDRSDDPLSDPVVDGGVG